MKFSYAITVCNEHKELYSLISFLKKVKDPEDEINVLVDKVHMTSKVEEVINTFKDDIVHNYIDFCGDFSEHRNHHIKLCTGDYIFVIDADEMPQELLIKNIKSGIEESGADLVFIPRINICPGYTQEWVDKLNFEVNQMGWINWPDIQGRIFKNNEVIKYKNKVHEKISDYTNAITLQFDPLIALWHIKSLEKHENCWDGSEYKLKVIDL